MRKEGADLFVGGSSSIFSKDAPIPENIARMRSALQDLI
jgi:pentose-5-phosphate-3-epimerase